MNAQLVALVLMLPTSWQPRVKGIVAALGTIAAVVVALVPDLPSWAAVVVAGLTWAGVYGLPALGYVPPATSAQHRA
jgi:hypothetical protein